MEGWNGVAHEYKQRHSDFDDFSTLVGAIIIENDEKK